MCMQDRYLLLYYCFTNNTNQNSHNTFFYVFILYDFTHKTKQGRLLVNFKGGELSQSKCLTLSFQIKINTT